MDNNCDGLVDCEDTADCPAGTSCGLHAACQEPGVCECNEGWGDCDGDAGIDCERSLLSDPDNCGECDHVCWFYRGVPECESGECRILECLAEWGDCNDYDGDGCETYLNDGHDGYLCGDAISLGSVCGDSGCDSGPSVQGYGEEHYEILVQDCEFEFPPGGEMSVNIELDVPPGLDYDLYVYSPCDELIASSTGGHGETEQIRLVWSDGSGDDDERFFIEVRYYDANRCDEWRLRTWGGCDY